MAKKDEAKKDEAKKAESRKSEIQYIVNTYYKDDRCSRDGRWVACAAVHQANGTLDILSRERETLQEAINALNQQVKRSTH